MYICILLRITYTSFVYNKCFFHLYVRKYQRQKGRLKKDILCIDKINTETDKVFHIHYLIKTIQITPMKDPVLDFWKSIQDKKKWSTILSLINAIGYVQTFYEFQTDICCIKKNAPKNKKSAYISRLQILLLHVHAQIACTYMRDRDFFIK